MPEPMASMHLPIDVTSTGGMGATAKYYQLVGDVSEPTSRGFDVVLDSWGFAGGSAKALSTLCILEPSKYRDTRNRR